MVSNPKDDNPTKTTPVTNRVPITRPRTVNQAAPHLARKSVARKKSKQLMTHCFNLLQSQLKLYFRVEQHDTKVVVPPPAKHTLVSTTLVHAYYQQL